MMPTLELFQISKMGSSHLKSTFDAIVEVFLFLDKNGDGKLNKKDMIKALNESSPRERSPAHITRTLFSIACFTCYTCNLYFCCCGCGKVLLVFCFSNSCDKMQRKWTGTEMEWSASGNFCLL